MNVKDAVKSINSQPISYESRLEAKINLILTILDEIQSSSPADAQPETGVAEPGKKE